MATASLDGTRFGLGEKSPAQWFVLRVLFVEMGRPSVLDARVEKRDGEVVSAWIGGSSVLVSEGVLYLD